ncbi:helix-turn-helix transcriptional regulator [Oryzicola mucosus]|uniref:Helix-turn-helix transcriptional regulator n=1 Tax=Oryzicola mucosus TaxID=2767425 RepID=A0A8J6Q0K8_9HYPH|nr:helix-turn-helix transcriptional regulator [Oryzicola mucosus]MBD0414020.1 helix-turn-helix transcriptional regulator [Oryzicola mucosus]
MTETLVERIYEAAFLPDLWPEVLGAVSELSGSVSGEFQILSLDAPPRWKATEITRDILGNFIRDGLWRDCERPAHLLTVNYPGFLCDIDYMTPEQIARDPVRRLLKDIGLGWQLGSLIHMPTGEIAAMTFERWVENGRPSAANVAVLDGLRPHMARSALIAARLGLERARATVSALDAIGLPAAVLSSAGQLLTANALFENLSNVFRAAAFGMVSLDHDQADAAFKATLETVQSGGASHVLSIPLPASESRQALVLHIIPLRRSVHDIFSGADILIAATAVSSEGIAPSPAILTGLFDLSPAEARLASELAGGKSLKEASAELQLTFKSGRTYLERIFLKTGTHRQSELVAMLRSVEPVRRAAE